jgi:predicted MPP superfamily phosphohydrolase
VRFQELVAALIFVSAVFVVFVTAAVFAGSRLYHRFVKKQPLGPIRSWNERISLSLAAVGFVCMMYGYFVEPYWPEVTHTKIPVANLVSPVRLVHLSDIHSDAKIRLEERLPELVRLEKPDAIVFTGDATNSPAGLHNFQTCLTKLTQLAPVFVVRGNWDLDIQSSDRNLFDGTGAQELNGTTQRLTIRNQTLRFIGAPAFELDKAMATVEAMLPKDIVIFLYHFPEQLSPEAQKKVDVVLAGHVHGGQVALPFYGALITLSRYGKKYGAGLYRTGKAWLYVSRGIGMEGSLAPRVRFCARPEIAVIDLVPQ